MNKQRPYVLSIAGFDPSGGAGVLADVKTFEQCGVYGMGVVSALTYQNDISFEKVEWLSFDQIIKQIEVLQKRFQFEYVKIGLIENLEVLDQLISHLKSHPDSHRGSHLKVVWDPILKASAGYEFHNEMSREVLENICKKLYLITPNVPEALKLGPFTDAEKNAKYLNAFCNVYLKGGHKEENKGVDNLYLKEGKQLDLYSGLASASSKHGSGCILSSAIAAGLARGLNLEKACEEAKEYITRFLSSNDSLLGYHSEFGIVQHG